MKVRLVDGALGGVVLLALAGACAPTVTVSRDGEEDAGGAGGTDTIGVGGTAGNAGSGANSTGGVGGDNVAPMGGTAGNSGAASGGSGGSDVNPCPCSRRSAAPMSRFCPRGTGVSQDGTLGPPGGELELSGSTSTAGSAFRIRVFSGSLEEETDITLSELTLAPHEDFFDYSPVYRIEPDELEFVNGGEVAIPWQVPSGQVPSDLAIYHSESADGPYELAADSYQNAGFSQATLLRSGYFFVGAPKPSGFEHCP